MAIKITLKNSVVQDSVPTTTHLPAVGELAVNANINSIGGYMRASDDTIVKIFGPGSVTTPAASTTVAGIAELATSAETTTGTDAARVVTPEGLKAVTDAERTTSNSSYMGASGGTLTGALTMPNGSNSAPSVNFGDADSGIFGGTNTVSLSAGGTTRLTADTGVSVVGTLAVTGAINSTDDLTIPDKIIHSGDTDTVIRFPAANTVSVETSGSEAFRVDGSGRLLVGHTANMAIAGTSDLANTQIYGTSSSAGLNIGRFNANSTGPKINLGKSRGAAIGTMTIVNDNDDLGVINFAGCDGVDLETTAAQIRASVDGTPAADDIPGRLEFYTFNAATDTLTEQLRIKNDGTHVIQAGTLEVNGAAETLLTLTSSDAGSSIKLADNTSHALITFDTTDLVINHKATGIGGGNLLFKSGAGDDLETWGKLTDDGWIVGEGFAIADNSSRYNSQVLYGYTGNTSDAGITLDGTGYERRHKIESVCSNNWDDPNSTLLRIVSTKEAGSGLHNYDKALAEVEFKTKDISNNEGRLCLGTNPGGSSSTQTYCRLQIEPNGNVGIGGTFEDGGSDIGGTSVVPDTTLHISSAESTARIESTTAGNSAFLDIKATNTGISKLRFADTDDDNVGMISYEHSTNSMLFNINDATKFRFDSGGKFLWNTATSVDTDDSPIQLVDHEAASGIFMKQTGNRKSLITADSDRNSADDQIFGLRSRWNGNDVAGIYFLTGDGATNKDNASIEFFTAPDSATGTVKRLEIKEDGQLLITPVSGMSTPAVNISSSSNSGLENKLRFTDTDPNTGGSQGIGKIEFYSSDTGGDGAGVSATVYGRADNSDGEGEVLIQTQSTGNGLRTVIKANMNGQVQMPLMNSSSSGTDVAITSTNYLVKKTSSRRYKKNIKTIEDATADKILNCNPVWFQRNEDDDTALGHYGFIAEEIHEIDPTFVVYEDKRRTLDSDGDYVYEDMPEQDWLPESVKYTDFIPLLLNLVKRQDARITALEAK